MTMTINPRQLSAATPPAAVPETAASRPPVGQLDPVGPRQGRSGDTTGRRRGGNPLGNPGLNLAPRCGARARSGCACRAPAMANGRCRMHGGRSTGPRTPEGKASRTAAHTTHGHRAAPQRKALRAARTLVRRMRLFVAAVRLQQYMPVEMAAQLVRYPLAFLPPEKPSHVVVVPNAPRTPCTCLPPLRRASRARTDKGTGGVVGLALNGRAAERAAAVTEVALQAPWREAIAFARAVKRAVLAEKRDAHAARRAAWAARRVVRAVTTTGRRGESGETGAVRLNPTQLSRDEDAAAGRSCDTGARLGPSPGGRSNGARRDAARPDGGRLDGLGGGDAAGCGGARPGGGRQVAEGAALFRPTPNRGESWKLDALPALGLSWLNSAAAPGSKPLVAGGRKLRLRAQLDGLFGAPALPEGWRVPQAWPPSGGAGAAFAAGLKPAGGAGCMTRELWPVGVRSATAGPPSRRVPRAGGAG